MEGGLFEYSFARHAAWWVSAGALGLIALFFLLDGFDRVRWWISDVRRERRESGRDRREDRFRVPERYGPLWRRFHRDVVPHSPVWTERRPNEPAERE